MTMKPIRNLLLCSVVAIGISTPNITIIPSTIATVSGVGAALLLAGCTRRSHVRQDTRIEQRTKHRYHERKIDDRRDDWEDYQRKQERIDQRNQ